MRMVIAMGQDFSFGKNSTMPWQHNQKGDLARFKALTTGGVVIMGRNTFESLGAKPLEGRVNIVVSSSIEPHPGCLTVRSIEAAADIANKQDNPVFIIGGKRIVDGMLKYVQDIYLTIIEHEFPYSDTFLTPNLLDGFKIGETQKFKADDKNTYDYRFELWRRDNN